MAGLNLGDVTFGLVADASGLQKALGVLSAFSASVNRAAAGTSKASQEVYRAFQRQEKVAADFMVRVRTMEMAVQRLGPAASGILGNLSQQTQKFVDSMTSGKLKQEELARATVYMSAKLNEADGRIRALTESLKAQERAAAALAQARERMANISSRATRLDAPAGTMQNLLQAHQQFESALQKQNLRQRDVTQAQRDFNKVVGDTNRALSDHQRQLTGIERQQRLIDAAQRRFRFAIRDVDAARLPPSTLAPVENALQNYTRNIRGGASATVTAASAAALRAEFEKLDGVVGAAEKKLGSWVNMVRDLERSVILAVGPLSGFGARLGVIAALMETGSIKTTLFLSSLTGLVGGLGYLLYKSVQAANEFQKMDAIFQVAAGTVAGAKVEYEYAVQVADKLGKSIRELGPEYGKFATAARLAGLSLEDQHKVFEDFMTASAGLRLSTEQTERIFKALRDMFSKGTVQAEELKGQLGDALPGAFSLAAKAMGKTEAELAKLMQTGDVAAKDLIPKLGTLVKAVYGTAADSGAQTLSAELDRTSTRFFELARTLDQVTGISNTVKAVVKGLGETFQYLKDNIDKVVAAIGAVTGAAVGGGLAALVTLMVASSGAARALAMSLAILGEALVAVTLRLVAFTLANPVTAVLTLTAALAGAVLGWNVFKKSAQESLDPMQDFTKEIQVYLENAEKFGIASRRVTEEHIKNLDMQIQATRAKLLTEQNALKQMEENARRQIAIYDAMGNATGVNPALLNTPEMQDQAGRIQELNDKLKELLGTWDQLMERWKKDLIDTSGAGALDKKVQQILDNVKDKIEELKGNQAAIEALNRGDRTNATRALAGADAAKLLNNLPAGKDAKAISDALKEGGFSGDLQEGLTTLIAKLMETQEQINKTTSALRNWPEVKREAAEKLKQLKDSIEDAGDSSLQARLTLQRRRAQENFQDPLLKSLAAGVGNRKEVMEQIKEFVNNYEKLQILERKNEGKSLLAEETRNSLQLQGREYEAAMTRAEELKRRAFELAQVLSRSSDPAIKSLAASLTKMGMELVDTTAKVETFKAVWKQVNIAENYYDMANSLTNARISAKEANYELTSLNATFERQKAAAQYAAELKGVLATLQKMKGLAQTAEEAQSIDQKINSLQIKLAQLDVQTNEFVNKIASAWENSFFNAFDSILSQGKSLGEALYDMFRNFALEIGRMLLRELAQDSAKALKNWIKTGSLGGSEGASSLAGVGGIASILTLFGYAEGGRPQVGKPIWVGEKGPEVWVPDSAGTIIPNKNLGGGTPMGDGTTIQFNQNIGSIGSNVSKSDLNTAMLLAEKRILNKIYQSRQRKGIFA